MIKCPSCAFENPDDGRFCTSCGQTLELPAAAREAPAKFCTECGAELPADSKFCTSCGKGFAGPGAGESGGGGGGTASAAGYLAAIDARLAANGFEKIDPPAVLGLDRFLRRKKFELAQIGMVTAVCGVKTLNEPATAAYAKDYSRAVFDAAVSKKGFLARNSLQQVLVYPVLVAPSVGPGVTEFVNSHWPKHWMAYEFAVVVSLGTREVLMHRATPVWQALSHSGFKKQAESLFAF